MDRSPNYMPSYSPSQPDYQQQHRPPPSQLLSQPYHQQQFLEERNQGLEPDRDQSQPYPHDSSVSPLSSTMSQQPSPSPSQQPHDANPQDVLAEARKNLQALMDSGLTKDMLHQIVEEGQGLPLSLSMIAQAQPLLNQPQPPQQQQIPAQQPQPAPVSLAPPPPPIRCPPPPPPPSVPSNVTTPTNVSGATTPSTEIKAEPLADDVSSIFLPPSAPFSHSHRPRISVSSTSSGSSGHASIWSTNSGQSSVSWQSTASTCRSQAPLPLPPSNPVGGPMGHPGSAAGKTNIYWCTSCETSFKRKYDWKRHEDEFHERWRKYPCPEPGCNRSFWGSNSFNQHHKQCHGCKTCPHAEKVVRFLRKRKYWACGFCSALHPARERHVEHVARHFESGMTKGDWMHSRVTYGLLHQPLIREAWDALVSSKTSEYNGRRPQFSWHPSKTGRAQGFLENENPGQLQDLLEFFSGDEGEAQWIVSVAYDLADIVLTSAPVPSPQYSHTSMMPQGFTPDPRLSFMTLPTQSQAQVQAQAQAQAQVQAQAHAQSMMATAAAADPSQQNPFAGFRSTMLVPSQQFSPPPSTGANRPSPNSSSHSPLAASTSPMMATPAGSSPLDKRDLPPPPQQHQSHDGAGEGMMDFEYSPAPVGFDDWDTFAGSVLNAPAQDPQTGAAPEWNMMQYFNDPRVTS